MKVRYGGDDPFDGDVVKWARGKVQALEDATGEELEQSMADGADYMRYFIATRGTNRPWSWGGGNKAGRIESGNMVEAVKHRVDRMTSGRVRGFFGWLDAWNNPENDYFLFQEGGFTHNRTGEFIEGMYALADAAEAAFEEMRGRIAARMRRL
jgi:hypothetical protein